MTINLKEMIRSQADCNDLSFRDDYSGRGMYDKCCVAVVGSYEQCQALVAELASELMTNVFEYGGDDEDAAYDYHDKAQEALASLLSYNFDSMGFGTVIYWKTLPTDC